MEIFSPGLIRPLFERAEELGIGHGLVLQDVLGASQSVWQKHYQRLSQLIAERETYAEQHARWCQLGVRWGLSPELLSGALIEEIREQVSQQAVRYDTSAEALDTCSVQRGVSCLGPLADHLEEIDHDAGQLPNWSLAGLFDLADLTCRQSILAYAKQPLAAFADSRCRHVTFLTNLLPNTQVLLFHYEGYAFVVFRGTQGLLDLAIDVMGVRVGQPGRHCGFHLAWRSVQPQIERWLQTYPDYKGVIFSGHSLGGALAILSAFELQAAVPVSAVFTFGAPRVGNAKFQTDYNDTLGKRTWRFEHGTDWITWVVPRWAGYRHVGQRISIRSGGTFQFQPITYADGNERDQLRADIRLRPPLENRLQDELISLRDHLPQWSRDLLSAMPWQAIPGVGAGLFWTVVVYALYKVLMFVVWIGRRAGRDYADHGKDKRYGWAIEDCAARINRNRWLVQSQADAVTADEARQTWLRGGSVVSYERQDLNRFWR